VSVPASNKCISYYCDPLVGVTVLNTPCPESCSSCDPQEGCQGCPSGLSAAEKAAIGISAGVVAAIVIGAIAFAALAGFGSKKAYDKWVKSNKAMGGATVTLILRVVIIVTVIDRTIHYIRTAETVERIPSSNEIPSIRGPLYC
jgi:hypothetical protein